jgi:hypothetical protein
MSSSADWTAAAVRRVNQYPINEEGRTLTMTGYTVHTGASKKFVSGWDRVFGAESYDKSAKKKKKKQKSGAKSANKTGAKAAKSSGSKKKKSGRK